MDKFLESLKIAKLFQEEIEHLNTLETSKKMELLIKKLPTEKTPGPELTSTFYQILEEFFTNFQKIEEEETLPTSSYKSWYYYDTKIRPKHHTKTTDQYRLSM